MERTITFIAEHKKREYEQVEEQTMQIQMQNTSPKEEQGLDLELVSDRLD